MSLIAKTEYDFLWRRATHDENGHYRQDLWFQTSRPDADDISEYAYGDTIGIHMLDSGKWMDLEEIYQVQKEYQEQFPEDFNDGHAGVSRYEVRNAVFNMWLMGLVERKPK